MHAEHPVMNTPSLDVFDNEVFGVSEGRPDGHLYKTGIPRKPGHNQGFLAAKIGSTHGLTDQDLAAVCPTRTLLC